MERSREDSSDHHDSTYEDPDTEKQLHAHKPQTTNHETTTVKLRSSSNRTRGKKQAVVKPKHHHVLHPRHLGTQSLCCNLEDDCNAPCPDPCQTTVADPSTGNQARCCYHDRGASHSNLHARCYLHDTYY